MTTHALAAIAIAILLQGLPTEVRSQDHADDFSGIWAASFPNDPDPTDLQAAMARNRALPDYQQGWAERARKTWEQSDRGEKVFDAHSDCYPPSLAGWYLFGPTEILMTPGQVTINTEYFNQTRRIFTDGRSHPAFDDLNPTFLGHSIGHWEGKTLVVNTVGLRNTLVSELRPFSDQLRITERIRKTGKDELEWIATLTDPVAFKTPFVMSIRVFRAPAGDYIREMVCQENRKLEKFAPPQP